LQCAWSSGNDYIFLKVTGCKTTKTGGQISSWTHGKNFDGDTRSGQMSMPREEKFSLNGSINHAEDVLPAELNPGATAGVNTP
jgi:hypothetical protein